MSLRWIGRVGPLSGSDEHGDPTFTWTGDPNSAGIRTATIAGELPWAKARALSGLTAIQANQQTVGAHTGVLEWLVFDDDLLRPFSGLYLLKPSVLGSADAKWSVTPLVAFSLPCVFLGGHRQPVVACSGREKANSYGVTGRVLIPTPFWSADPNGALFANGVAGATFGGRAALNTFTREYDATTPRSLAAATAPTRQLRIYEGAPASLPPHVVPVVDQLTAFDGASVPRWASDRGGDVRAYDRSSGEEAFPGHTFRSSTDLKVGNGLVEFWVGSVGLPPYLTVSAVANGSWREVGYLYLGGPGVLAHARILRASSESITLALTTVGAGDIYVTLKRSERMIRVDWQTQTFFGESTPDRRVHWAGLPPTSLVNAAPQAAGRFGQGLNVPLAGTTDVHLLWPPVASPSSWSTVLWLRAEAAASAGTAGLLTAYDAAGNPAATVNLDPGDHRFHFVIGSQSVSSPVQTYGSGADIAVGIRFSTTNGMSISVLAGGVVSHAYAPTATSPAAAYAYFAYLVGTGAITTGFFGDGAFGDGPFGGSGGPASSVPAGGVVDNHMIFDTWLSDTRMAAVLASTSPLAGLGPDEGRMVWYAPYDARTVPVFSALTAAGRIFEATASGGSTRNPDADGLTKALLYLDSAGANGVGAALATTATLDDLQDHHAQFCAEWDNPVMVR